MQPNPMSGGGEDKMSVATPTSPSVKPKRPGEDIFGLLVLMGSLFLLWTAYQISGFSSLSSPGSFPMAVALVMVLASAHTCWDNIRRNRAKVGIDRTPLLSKTAFVFLLMIIAYGALLEPLGFLLSSFLFLIGGMTLLRAGSLPKILGLVVLCLVVIYVLFRLTFQVVLPQGIVPEAAIISAISDLFAGAK